MNTKTFATKRPVLGVFTGLGVWAVLFSLFGVASVAVILVLPAIGWMMLLFGGVIFLLALIPSVLRAGNFYDGDCPYCASQTIGRFPVFKCRHCKNQVRVHKAAADIGQEAYFTKILTV